MATTDETKAVLAAISLAYPGRFRLDASQLRETIVLWQGLLADIGDGIALEACRALIASSTFPPSIAELRSEALSVGRQASKLGAGDAWGEVTRAFGSHGRDRVPKWSSPAITLAVRAVGGWRHLCVSSNAAADRARFLDHFSGVFARAERDVLTGKAPTVDAALELMSPAVARLVERIANNG